MEISQEKKPKFRVITEHIKAQIMEGKYAPQDKLPSQRAMTRLYNASMFTVRQSLMELENEGWLKSEHGRGVYVTMEDSREPGISKENLNGDVGFVWWYNTTPQKLEREVPKSYMALLHEAVEVLGQQGRKTVYATLRPDDEQDNQELVAFVERLERVIITGQVDPGALCRLTEMRHKIVIAGHTLNDKGLEEFSQVICDVRSAGMLAAQVLTVHGHQRIALVNEAGSLLFEEIGAGFVEFCKSSGIPIDDRYCASNAVEEREVAEQLVAREDITGIVVVGI